MTCTRCGEHVAEGKPYCFLCQVKLMIQRAKEIKEKQEEQDNA